MKSLFFLNLILISLICSVFVHGQDKPFALFTEDDGLADNDVRDIIKDKEGYLWIGTSNGLSKYDGQKFTNIQVEQGMPGRWVWSVEKDDKNRIYAGCFSKGLAIIENDKIIKVLHLEENVKNRIRRLHYSDVHKLMFVGTDYGIYALKDTIFTLLSYPNAPSQKSAVLSISEYKGVIYFTILNDKENGGFFKLEINDADISKSIATKIIGGQGFGSAQIDGKIIFCIGNKIYKYSPESKNANEIIQTDEQFTAWAVGKLSPNVVGLGGFGDNRYQSGLKFLNVSNNSISLKHPDFGIASVNHIFYDQELNCPWVGSTEGIYCLYQSPFTMWNIPNQSELIKDIIPIKNSVYALTENSIWEIKNGDLALFKTKQQLDNEIYKKADLYFLNKDLNAAGQLTKYNLYETIIKGKSIIPLQFIEDNGKCYLITSYGTISFPELDRYLPIPHGQFTTDKETGKVLWVPSYGDFRYFKSIDTSLEIPNFKTNQNIEIKDVSKILRSGQLIYFGSWFHGLFALKGKDGFNLSSKNSVFDDSLSDIDIDNQGNLWSTSFDGKLYEIKFDNELQIAKTYNKLNSQIIGNSYKWLKFSKSYLYIGTNKGLNKIPISQLGKDGIDTVFFFNKFNGYDFISAESARIDRLGNLFLSTPHQIIKISNDTFPISDGTISFRKINIDGIDYSFEHFNKTSLSSSTKNINIGFNILKYPRSINVDYQYKVNDNVWEIGNSIILQSLKSGDYIVTCKAVDKETSNSYQREIIFHINNPFWLSVWFVSICALSLVLLVYWAISYRFNQQKWKQEEKNRLTREIADLHIQSLQSQMNPHFVFNSLNSIQNFILLNKPDDAIKYLGTLGGIIRMNLEYISEEYISLSDEIRFLEKYLEIEKMRFKEILDATISNSVFDSNNTFLPPMLIQPLIENSIKHGIRSVKYQGRIGIEFSTENDLLVVKVTDNGIGREQSQKNRIHHHKSFGLDLIYGRLALLNKKNETMRFQILITDLFDSTTATGTQVTLTIPQLNQTNGKNRPS